MKERVKIGIVQMEILSDISNPDVKEVNITNLLKHLAQVLSKESLDLVVIPEEFIAGAGYSAFNPPESLEKLKTTVIGQLGRLAAQYNTYIIGAFLAKLEEHSFKGNNIGFVIDRKGEFLGYQERFHQTGMECNFTEAGTEYRIFNLDFGKVGLMIGLDILYPEVGRNFALLGAEILVSPMLYPGQARNEGEKYCYPNDCFVHSAIARAMENQVYTIMVNGTGSYAHKEAPIFGESLAAGPLGLIYQAGSSETTAIFQLDMGDKMEAYRRIPLMDLRNADICKVK